MATWDTGLPLAEERGWEVAVREVGLLSVLNTSNGIVLNLKTTAQGKCFNSYFIEKDTEVQKG